MNILIILQADSELICYEGMSLAFVLASFDYKVQVYIKDHATTLLFDNKTRLHGMAKSAPLYDLPSIWLDNWATLAEDYPEALRACLCLVPDTLDEFDTTLTF